MKEDLMRIANALVLASQGVLRLAFNEDDTAHFLKLNGRRLGRDIELYGWMAKMMGERSVLPDFVGEVVIPLRVAAPSAYALAVTEMKAYGRKLYPADKIPEWDAIFSEPTGEAEQP